jgi:hypothetical protein
MVLFITTTVRTSNPTYTFLVHRRFIFRYSLLGYNFVFWYMVINVLMKPVAFIFNAGMKMKKADSLETLELSNMLHGATAQKTIM